MLQSRHLCGCKANQHQAVPRDLPEDVRRAFEDEKSRRMEDAITKTALSVVKTVMSHKVGSLLPFPCTRPRSVASSQSRRSLSGASLC